MRIHAILLARDEGDIIDETLASALEWCDSIYAFDNGSEDETWRRIKARAAMDRRVVPYRSAAVPFTQALRGEVFRHYRHRVKPGDWWCVLDADEIYIDPPRAFLSSVPERYGEVWSSSFQYYFTDRDLARYEADPEVFLRTPIQERLRYYLNNWSESRFFRHHEGLTWPPGDLRRPLGIGRPYPERIRLRHYQYRSPEQIERRLRARGSGALSHSHERRGDWLARVIGEHNADARPAATSPTWRDRVVPSRHLQLDSGRSYETDEAQLPPLPSDRHHVLRVTKHRAQVVLSHFRQALRA